MSLDNEVGGTGLLFWPHTALGHDDYLVLQKKPVYTRGAHL